MRQEDLNAMMRYPGEARQQSDKALPECPACGQRYLGDGVALCLECAAQEQGGSNDNQD